MKERQLEPEQAAWWWPLTSGESLLSSEGAMMDFLEQTVEILLREDRPTKDVAAYQAVASSDLLRRGGTINSGRSSVSCSSTRAVPPAPQRDYAGMHDRFLESLLQEQAKNPHPLTREDSFSPDGPPPALTECRSDSTSTMTSFASQDDSNGPPDAKKRRLVRLQRRHSTTPVLHRHYTDIHYAEQDDDDSSCAPKSVDLQGLSGATAQRHPPPESFVHAHCRMQKDKGKGELPGKDVCAEGRDKCMEKLRQKMELLAQVALGNATPAPATSSSTTGTSIAAAAVKKTKGKTADMKRRKARVSASTQDHVETRSVIQLRMGFLSMQYGVLLRWDRTTHLIVFVLLRKMCSDSFYHKTLTSNSLTSMQSSYTCTDSQPSTPLSYLSSPTPLGYVIKSVVNGNCAVVQRHGECEVVMIDPPYLANRPSSFPPSLLSVHILNVDGLNPTSIWIVKIVVRGDSKTLRLGWNQDDASFEPRNSDTMKLHWQVTDESSSSSSSSSIFDLQMDMMVYEKRNAHKRGRSRQQRVRRLKTTLPVPTLDSMSSTTSSSGHEASRSRFVVVPVDEESSLTLSIHFQSDYAHWLQQEVDARKQDQEGVSSILWRAAPAFFHQAASAATCSPPTTNSATTTTRGRTTASTTTSSSSLPALVETTSAIDNTYFFNPFDLCCAW